MIRQALILVFLLFLSASLWIGLACNSSVTYFPGLQKLRIDPDAPSVASFPFAGELNGMKRIDLELPLDFRRRPLTLSLLDGKGTKAADVRIREKTKKKGLRIFILDPVIEDSAGRNYTLEIHFADGPALPRGAKAAAFDDMAITMEYDLDAAAALRNLSLFKPIPHPVSFLGVLFLLYAVATSILLSLLWPRSSESGGE